MDITALPNDKRSVSALILIPIFIGLLFISGGCTGTTEAASDLLTATATNAPALAAGQQILAAPGAAQEGARLRFDPSPGQVRVGSVVAVQIRLENVNNLYGVEVHLTFDKDILQVEDDNPNQDGVQITPGDMPPPDFPVQNMVDNFGGRLDYAVVQLAPRPPANGSGVVATIHFRGVREGTSPIDFSSAKLASPQGLEIPAALQAGSIVVSASTGPTATPSPTATSGPTATPSSSTATPAPGDVATPSPSPTATPAIASCPALYVVRSGDTASAIAQRFGISLEELANANKLSLSADIKIGQLLQIPGVPGPAGTLHVVQSGETLYSIARAQGTSVETLAAINHLPHPWQVNLGQTLLICPQTAD